MLSTRPLVFLALVAIPVSAASTHAEDDARKSLWAAVRNGDPKGVKALLAKGAEVNAKNEIGITALWIAASKDKAEVVQLLVKAGADVNARDGIWYQTPLSLAVGGGHAAIVTELLRAGAKDVDAAVISAAAGGKLPVLRAVLDNSKPRREALDAALFLAAKDKKEIRQALEKAGAKTLQPAAKKDREQWKPLAGTYEGDNGGKMTFEVLETGLALRRGSSHQALRPVGPDTFRPVGLDSSTFLFERKNGVVQRVILKQYTAEVSLFRSETKPVPKAVNPPREDGTASVAAPLPWPAFRGPDGTGIADGQHPPLTWDVKKGTNVRWKTPIPGLGHSCPIVWGDRVFVTTAISGDPNPKLRIGNYGDVDSVNDTSKHTWQILCLDRASGKILWTQTAYEGVPKIKRHQKGSQANCTPATDGKRVVACFGPEGLYCYNFEGKLLWKRDLSSIDSSFAMDREYEWGFGSSPIIYNDLVILQCDLSKDSFIAAYRLEDGSRAWSTPRDEIPSWSSPIVWRNSRRAEVVTNASQYARGYDPATGKELWRLAKKSEATIPMPVIGRDLVYITSGNRPIQPIFAVRPGAAGDISLGPNSDRNELIAWSKKRGGPYMTTPIVYGGYLYVCANAGMLTCYEADTGAEVYKERLGGVSYTASPVAADGRLYFTTEQGEVRVVKASPKFELLAVNEMGDVCMATPAISDGMLFVRSQHYLFALGRTPQGADSGKLPAPTEPGVTVLTTFPGATGPGPKDAPDNSGAVGPNHVVDFTNANVVIHDKKTGKVIQRMTQTEFWKNTKPAFNFPKLNDPRLLYDPLSKRWFAVIAEFKKLSVGYLAVSESSDPTKGWKAAKLPMEPTDPGMKLGVDKNGLYIAFYQLTGDTHTMMSVHAIPIADAIAPDGPSLAHLQTFSKLEIECFPATDLDPNKAPDAPAVLLNHEFGNSFSKMFMYKITWAGNTASISKMQTIPLSKTYIIPNASGKNHAVQPAPGEKLRADEGRRTLCVYQHGDSLFTCNEAKRTLDSRCGIFWCEIRAKDGALLQEGFVDDPDCDYLVPSLAVDARGNLGLGCTRTSAKEYPSVYVMMHDANDPPNTMRPAVLAAKGTTIFSSNRKSKYGLAWGNYNSTCLDPSDPTIFWTYQEYATSSTPGQWTTCWVAFKRK